MRNVFFLLALCGLAGVGYGWGRDLIAGRMRSQMMRMEVLGDKLDALIAQVKTRDSTSLNELVDDLEHRIQHIEGNECHDDEFSCGRNSGQCIYTMLVCDGNEDCENGHDEQAELCTSPVQPGRAWTGYVDWESCISRGRDKVTIVITDNKRNEWFPSQIHLGATVALTHSVGGEPVSDTINASGEFSFGSGKFHLSPSADSPKRIGVVCEDHGKHMTKCTFINESDGHTCGSGILTAVQNKK